MYIQIHQSKYYDYKYKTYTKKIRWNSTASAPKFFKKKRIITVTITSGSHGLGEMYILLAAKGIFEEGGGETGLIISTLELDMAAVLLGIAVGGVPGT